MKTLALRIDRRRAIATVLVLHLAGLLALATPLASWALPLTPFNLILTALVMIVYSELDRSTVMLALLLGTLGFFVEVLGVHTGLLFGVYTYGDVLGPKVANVPLLIGLNWSMLVFAFGVPLSRLQWPVWAKVLVGSLAMIALDLLIEPVAVHLGFWTWEGGHIPMRNYIAWGVVSAVLFTFYFLAPVRRRNPMAASVLLAQVLFFAGLNLWLGSA